LGGDTPGRLDRRIIARAKIKASKGLLCWLVSLYLEMTARYAVRLTGTCFRLK
jgi:hypothetical protein